MDKIIASIKITLAIKRSDFYLYDSSKWCTHLILPLIYFCWYAQILITNNFELLSSPMPFDMFFNESIFLSKKGKSENFKRKEFLSQAIDYT